MTPSPRTPHVLKTCPLLVSGLGVELFGDLCSPHHTCPFPLGGGAPATAILAQPSPGTRPAWLGPQWPLKMVASKVAGGVGDRKAEKAGTSDFGRRVRSLPGSRRSPVQPALRVRPVPPGPRPGCLGVSPHLPTSPRLVSAWLSPCPWG